MPIPSLEFGGTHGVPSAIDFSKFRQGVYIGINRASWDFGSFIVAGMQFDSDCNASLFHTSSIMSSGSSKIPFFGEG